MQRRGTGIRSGFKGRLADTLRRGGHCPRGTLARRFDVRMRKRSARRNLRRTPGWNRHLCGEVCYLLRAYVGIFVEKGDTVIRGQWIGKAGATGCVDPPTASHLHFSALRTTNLSGYRSWTLTYPDTDRGINSIRGIIDPFGWDAPKQIDPWAWAFLGEQTDPYEGKIMNPGAFSIYLWISGEAPPTAE